MAASALITRASADAIVKSLLTAGGRKDDDAVRCAQEQNGKTVFAHAQLLIKVVWL